MKLQVNSSGSKPFDESMKSIHRVMDGDFLQQLVVPHGKNRIVGQYREIFRSKGECLAGDIMSKHSMTRERVIRDVTRCFPGVKFVLFLNALILRVWSRLTMAHRNGLIESNELLEPDRLLQALERPLIIETIEWWLPARIARRWQAMLPPPADTLRIFFFDDIVRSPEQTIRQLLEFLGADVSKAVDLPPGFTRKANLHKLTVPDSICEILVEKLSSEFRSAGAEFGEHAHS